MNDHEIDSLLASTLANNVSPNSKLDLHLLNEAKRTRNQEKLSKEYRKSILLALSLLLPFSIFVACVICYLFITNLFIKIIFLAYCGLGFLFILSIGQIAFRLIKKEKGVLV